jgi:hypothetical protein
MHDFIKVVRSLLLDEFKDFDKRITKLRAMHDHDGYSEFLRASFLLAARRRFGPETPIVTIIRFVANVRVIYDVTGTEIDPRAAERLIRTATGEDDPLEDLPMQTLQHLQIILIHKLIDDEALYDDEVEDFLHQAQTLAVRWRTQAAVETLERLGYAVQMPKPQLTTVPQQRLAS